MKTITQTKFCRSCIFALILILQQCSRVNDQSSKSIIKEITTPAGYAMILIPDGSFRMGSIDGNGDEAPIHTLSITGFAMDKYEVNQEKYEEYMLAAPSHFKGTNHPVEQVRWSDAAKFCNIRSQKEGLQPVYDETSYTCNFDASGYRLPTEAEWEYAGRAGTATEYDFGVDKQKLAAYSWYADNSNKRTAQVGTKKPNAWGIFDLYGNVSEWCNDRYDENYYRNSPDKDPRGPDKGDKRVLRGGAWNSSADACRVAYRQADVPGITDACFARDSYGFRCVRRLTLEERNSLNQQVK